MSTALRAAVCRKLGLSATASQADVYRAALKKIGLRRKLLFNSEAEAEAWLRRSDTYGTPHRANEVGKWMIVIRQNGHMWYFNDDGTMTSMPDW